MHEYTNECEDKKKKENVINKLEGAVCQEDQEQSSVGSLWAAFSAFRFVPFFNPSFTYSLFPLFIWSSELILAG